MQISADQYLASPNKRVTLMGMSGIGKTTLARKLSPQQWFHYSGDYRIGSRYLNEEIGDLARKEAMASPFLAKLLRSDSLFIGLNLTIDNLAPMSEYLGKVGNPDVGGIPLAEFKRRQKLHHDAEVQAIIDVPSFIEKAQNIYGYSHFLCDIGGSLCELEDPQAIETLADNTVLLYIRASESDQNDLVARAKSYPKPLYYPEQFLEAQLTQFKAEHRLEYIAQIDPDAFVVWVFDKLFHARIPKYEAIAKQYGYAVSNAELLAVQHQDDFDQLVARALERTCR